jgi:hypothetical protein
MDLVDALRGIIRTVAVTLRAGRSEALLVASLLGGGLLFLLVFAFAARQKEQKKLSRTLEERFQRLIRERDLTMTELDLIDRLSRYLRDRRKRYLLLVNPHTFASTLGQLQRAEPVAGRTLDGLKRKLGFDGDRGRPQKRTTGDLPVGTPVKIEPAGGGPRTPGMVASQQSAALHVLVEESPRGLHAGQQVLLYGHDYRGIWLFRTRILSAHERDVRLVHAGNEILAGGRAVVASGLALKVFVRAEGDDGEGSMAKLNDLYAGGAVLENPDRRFRKGDDIQIFFRQGVDRFANVNAEVVGARAGGLLMVVRFSHLRDDVWADLVGLASKSPLRRVVSS